MNVFKMDIEFLDNLILEYGNLADETEEIAQSMVRIAYANLNTEVWVGDDADIFRVGISSLVENDMTSFINKLRKNISIMKDSSEEFKYCKLFCENMINVFDDDIYTNKSVSDMNDVLLCDYDFIEKSIEYCKKIEEKKYEIETSLSEVKCELLELNFMPPGLSESIEIFGKEVSRLKIIESHRADLIKYASMVRDADERLANKLFDLSNDPSLDTLERKQEEDDLKEKYWFLYDYLANEKKLSENDAVEYMEHLREKNLLGSYWATYNYSGNDYNKLLEKIDCDLWIMDQKPFLDGYLDEKGVELSDGEKEKLLTEYYYRYYETLQTIDVLPSAGMAACIDNVQCEIDFLQYENMCMKKEDYSYDFSIFEEDVSSYDEMFSLQTTDILARCIYQECQSPEGQTDVMWSIINRYYSDKNFTKGHEESIYNILKYGQYESIDINDGNTYNAYHPDYNSDGWKNATLIAQNVYTLVGDNIAEDTDENNVREKLENSVNVCGDKMYNSIGNKDSFWGDGKENHFYEM